GRSAAAARLLVDPGYALAAAQLHQHILGLQAMPGEQHEAMEPEVRDLTHETQFITLLRGEQAFGRFLAHLAQDRILATREQPGDVRARRVRGATLNQRLAQALQNGGVDHRPSSPFAVGAAPACESPLWAA